MAELTPMMQQYLRTKAENPDCILFFRLGDFYEMFMDDAKLASKELDLTLTTRDRNNPNPDERVPMCGVPYHSVEGYLARLVQKGYKVAICEQTEDPAQAKGLVRREITRVVTPGTVTESSMLEERRNNYFACVYGAGSGFGLAFADISTGECYAAAADLEKACNELARFEPREVLLGGTALDCAALDQLLAERLHAARETGDETLFDLDRCTAVCRAQFAALGEAEREGRVLQAVGGLLQRLKALSKSDLGHIRQLQYYVSGQFMELDLTARRNLELTETLRNKEKRGSLLWVLDQTQTAMGGRMLRSWLEKPLLNPRQIAMRQDAVEELVRSTVVREELRAQLDGMTDFERVMSRLSAGTASAKDLAQLAAGAAVLPAIRSQLAQTQAPLLQSLLEQLDPLDDVREQLERAIADNPPAILREGGMIAPGFSPELDRLREIRDGGGSLLEKMEAEEREKTGIRTLRVRANRVYGYYIEVPRSYTGPVPDNYIRKQTTTTGERYFTPELKELENTVLTAREQIVSLEYDLFCQLRQWAVEQWPRIQATAAAVAQADVLACFAAAAVRSGYTRPEVDLSGEISITAGRHPVVERMLRESLFVPNDTALGQQSRVAIITGPNMAGKSTYMRQVALIVLMAQIGSFVPAGAARIGVVDRIFTRIGASDDLTAGQSTFMVEMTEVAEILAHATPRSLLILDEIGRGTSTFDGMAIARAVLEYAAARLGAKTLFATHYHELTALEQSLEGVRNYNIAVKRRGGDIVFLRKIVPGAADESLGVEVARLAGLPQPVITRARALLRELESAGPATPAPRQAEPEGQLAMGDPAAESVSAQLRALNVETMTPIEALNELYRLRRMLG